MTDNEIIKALERMSAEDADGFSSDILDLIKLQQAEIERLSKPQGVTFLANGIEIHAKDSDEYYKFKRLVKSEAITEFAERLIEETRTFSAYDGG